MAAANPVLTVGACVFALALAAPTPAFAQTPPTTEAPAARAAFDEGVAHARADRWEAALAAFARSRARVDRPGTALNVALALRHLGRLREARQALRECLAMPETSAEADIARDAALLLNVVNDAIATLTLSAAVTPLTVRVDGEIAQDPRVIELDPGAHRVEVSSPGHVPRAFTLDLAPGARVSRAVDLEVVSATVTLSATPRDARLFVNGAPVGRGDATWNGPAGTLTLRASREGYEDLARAVTVGPGEEATHRLALTPRSRPLTARPWFWVTVGVAAAVIAGATTAAVLLAPGEPSYSGGSTGAVLRAF
ncbi:MAG: PEGA domain-containing protein [Polyangiales bacterium]